MNLLVTLHYFDSVDGFDQWENHFVFYGLSSESVAHLLAHPELVERDLVPTLNGDAVNMTHSDWELLGEHEPVPEDKPYGYGTTHLLSSDGKEWHCRRTDGGRSTYEFTKTFPIAL